MKPNYLLAATASGKTILLKGILAENTIYIIGTTVPMSAKPGDIVHSFALYPEHQEGIVALSVYAMHRVGKHQHGTRVPFLLEVIAPGDDHTPVAVTLANSWVPLRPGQVYDTHLEVQIGGQRFTSQPPNVSCASRGLRYVPDPNLLCRYLLGETIEDEVRTAAAEYIEEVSAREQLAEALKRLAELEQRVQDLAAEVSREANVRNDTVGRVWLWYNAAWKLQFAAQRQWLKGRSIRQALREFPREGAFFSTDF